MKLQTTNYELQTARSGFIALTSVLILLAFMLILTMGISLTSFISRGTASNSYYKEISRSLAESCIQKAMLGLAATTTYSGNETYTVASSTLGSDTCTIGTVFASGTQFIVPASGSFKSAKTNLRATVNAADLGISGWEELKSF